LSFRTRWSGASPSGSRRSTRGVGRRAFAITEGAFSLRPAQCETDSGTSGSADAYHARSLKHLSATRSTSEDRAPRRDLHRGIGNQYRGDGAGARGEALSAGRWARSARLFASTSVRTAWACGRNTDGLDHAASRDGQSRCGCTSIAKSVEVSRRAVEAASPSPECGFVGGKGRRKNAPEN